MFILHHIGRYLSGMLRNACSRPQDNQDPVLSVSGPESESIVESVISFYSSNAHLKKIHILYHQYKIDTIGVSIVPSLSISCEVHHAYLTIRFPMCLLLEPPLPSTLQARPE